MSEKRLHIGLFNDSFFPMADGVIMVVDNYARRLIKYADVTVFVPGHFKKNFDDSRFPYEVVRCKSVKVPHLDYSLPLTKIDRKFLAKLNSYNLDIVHLHSPFMIGRISSSESYHNIISSYLQVYFSFSLPRNLFVTNL